MKLLYHGFVGLFALATSCSALRSISDYNDTGNCVGELHPWNSPFLPEHYSIYLDLNPQMGNFRGDVNISGTLTEGNLIELHSVKLNVTSVRLRLNGMELDNITWYMTDENYGNGSLNINLNHNTYIFNNDHFSVGVSYEGVFDETAGIIMQNYIENDSNRWMIFTHLEPDSARRVFPSVDLPRYKAKFDISISKTKLQDRIVLSNMPPKSQDKNVIKFQTTPLMSTYLVAFVISDYVPLKYKSNTKYSEKHVTTWVPEEMKHKYEASFIRLQTPQILEALEDYYGSACSLPKLDMYVVMEKPGIGGMENLGLVMYQFDSFMKDKRAMANDYRKVISTIAHELAHHWSGNSVTVADWCGIWLQEAIPTFLSGIISQQMFGDLDEVNTVKWAARMEAMSEECRIPDLSPLRDDQIPMTDPSTLFTRARYVKGANLLNMIESVVTPKVFKKSLRSLYEKYTSSFADETDLWRIVDESCGKEGFQKAFNAPTSLDEIAKTWVTYPSHPIVVLERSDDGTLKLTQKVCTRFSTQGFWWIPISYTTSTAPNFNITTPQQWIIPGDPEDDFTEVLAVLNIKLDNTEWIILNIMGSGTYRVDYDDVTWDLLISQLKRDVKASPNKALIPPFQRAMLVDDSFRIANTGKHLVKAFRILGYVKKETSNYVWGAIKENIRDSYGMFPPEEQKLFKKYAQFLMEDVFKRVTKVAQWKAKQQKLELVNERILRETVFELAYIMGLPALSEFGRKIALDVINEEMDKNIIPPEVERWLWCAAVSIDKKQDHDEIFKYLTKLFNSAESKHQRNEILKSMTCSKFENQLLLNLILKNYDRASKATLRAEIMEFLLSHWPSGCSETLSFLKHNKERLVDNESEWSEFRARVKNPPIECKKEAERMFGPLDSNDDKESDEAWREMYGKEPLEWLRNNSRQWEC